MNLIFLKIEDVPHINQILQQMLERKMSLGYYIERKVRIH